MIKTAEAPKWSNVQKWMNLSLALFSLVALLEPTSAGASSDRGYVGGRKIADDGREPRASLQGDKVDYSGLCLFPGIPWEDAMGPDSECQPTISP